VFYIIVTEDNNMLSANNNDYHYNEREKNVLELYKNGKNTRDIAKEQRMSLRDISTILRKNHESHGSPSTDNDNNNNNQGFITKSNVISPRIYARINFLTKCTISFLENKGLLTDDSSLLSWLTGE
jgi:hypothetical protein